MEFGGYRVDAVVDGEGRLRPDEALPDVPAACRERHRALLDDGGLLPIVIGGFLLRGCGRTLLVDLGYGPGALGDTPTGRMPGPLRALGVEPADVTDVLLTHLHRDHVGWAANGGVAVFPHARLFCGAADRAYFVEQRHDQSVADLFIPPSAHDGGTALGCALYGMIECLEEPSQFRWTNDFLGPDPDAAAVEAAVRSVAGDHGLVVDQPADIAASVAELLDLGYVVGVHQGRSESGPRALGNCSIIGDARHPAMRDFINFQVKGREWFRPLAPLVLADATPAIFDVDRPAPFMQLAIDVRPEHRDALPAITHVDGTARIQTVESRNTPFLHALLTAFADRTGCPVLINTSLNGKGDPLTEAPEDSLACLTGTQMHALVMPPFLIRKRDAVPVPSGWQP